MGNPARADNDAHVPTVREYLPWHVVRQKLAERGVVIEDGPMGPPPGIPVEEASPPSGVRINEKLAMNDVELPPANEEGLSFKVYTLQDLDRRHGDSVPPVIRPSMAALADMPKTPSPWKPVGKALLAMLYAMKTWVLLGRGRPPFRDAFRAPSVVLGLELKNATKHVDWRRVGFGLAAGLGTTVVLLFAVLTVAELTDDLKPARTDGMTTMQLPAAAPIPDTTAAAPAAQQPPAPEPAQAAADPVDELDAPAPAAAPAKPVAKPVKKPAAKKPAPKKAKSEVFIP